MRIIEIYCDGSGTTWDKAAGYGFVIIVDGEFHSEGHGHIPQGTNNDAEMAAAIKGMLAARDLIKSLRIMDEIAHGEYKLKLCSDSQLCLGWASDRYRHNNPDRKKTVALLQELFREMSVEPVWVKGHNGHVHNSRADALAHYGRTGEFKRKRDKKSSDNGQGNKA
jgi:ribonuclease HI